MPAIGSWAVFTKAVRARDIGEAQTPSAAILLGYKSTTRKHNPFTSFCFGLRVRERKAEMEEERIKTRGYLCKDNVYV